MCVNDGALYVIHILERKEIIKQKDKTVPENQKMEQNWRSRETGQRCTTYYYCNHLREKRRNSLGLAVHTHIRNEGKSSEQEYYGTGKWKDK